MKAKLQREFQKFSDAQLKEAEFFILTGNELFLKSLARQRILEIKKSEDFEYKKWSGAELNEDEFWSGFQNFSLFSANQIWLITSAEELNANFYKSLKSQWSTKATGLNLIIEGQFERGAFPESLAELGIACEFFPPFPSQIFGWVRKIAQWQNVKIDDDAISQLVDKFGSNLQEHQTALITLKNFKGASATVTAKDVQDALTHNQEEGMFQIIDLFFEKRTREFLLKISRLWSQGEAPTAFISLVARQVRILMKVDHGVKQGLDDSKLASLAEVAPFFVTKYIKQIKLWKMQELENLIVELAELDQAIKSTGVDGALLIEERLSRFL